MSAEQKHDSKRSSFGVESSSEDRVGFEELVSPTDSQPPMKTPTRKNVNSHLRQRSEDFSNTLTGMNLNEMPSPVLTLAPAQSTVVAQLSDLICSPKIPTNSIKIIRNKTPQKFTQIRLSPTIPAES